MNVLTQDDMRAVAGGDPQGPYTNTAINPSTKQFGQSTSNYPIPSGTQPGGGWVTTSGSSWGGYTGGGGHIGANLNADDTTLDGQP